MLHIILQNWEMLAAIFAGVWGILTYLRTQRNELAWKRSEFICGQLSKLDEDAILAEITMVLFDRHHTYSINDFLRIASAQECSTEENNFFMAFERYLNFLWRICYAHVVLNTLKDADINSFGAYLWAIRKHKGLYNYCLNEGFDEINKSIEILGPLWRKSTESGSRGFFSPSPHTTWHAGPHQAVHKGYRAVAG